MNPIDIKDGTVTLPLETYEVMKREITSLRNQVEEKTITKSVPSTTSYLFFIMGLLLMLFSLFNAY